MEQALHELPLALFTTFAPISAGAFIVLVLAGCFTSLNDEQRRLLDRLSWVALGVLAFAFVCAFFHLTQPFNAINVFAGLGRSPLSNEIVAGMVFFATAFAYCLFGAIGLFGRAGAASKDSTPSVASTEEHVNRGREAATSRILRVLVGAAVCLSALVFVAFIGFAYLIHTIPSWNTPWIVVSVLGFALSGGTLFGMLLVYFAGALEETKRGILRLGIAILLVVGAALALVGTFGQVSVTQSLSTYLVEGSNLFTEVSALVVLSAVAFVISIVLGIIALFKARIPLSALLVSATALALIAIFLARLSFYALYVSVAL